MDIFRSRYPMMAALLFAAAVGAPAQQKIEFSKPEEKPAADAPASGKENSAHPAPGGQRWTIGAYNAPRPGIDNPRPNSQALQPMYYQGISPAAQQELNKRKNWTLLTPEQIMGVQTPEEILGVANLNGENKLSLEQQFLLRESRARAASATNNRPAMLRGSASPFDIDQDDQNPFGRRSGDNAQNSRSDERNLSGGFLNRLLNGTPSVNQRKADSEWASVFSRPAQPKPDQAQTDAIERFRALMQPSSPPEKAASPIRFSKPPAPSRNSFLQPQPAYNPAGRSAAVLEDKISRPKGIQPLPGAVTKPVQPAAKRPSWQAQLPPWLSDKPQH